MGAREADCRRRLPGGSSGVCDVSRAYGRPSPGDRMGLACAADRLSERPDTLRGGADCGAERSLSTQIVRNTGERISGSGGVQRCADISRKLPPRVRRGIELSNGEEPAKGREFEPCARTGLRCGAAVCEYQVYSGRKKCPDATGMVRPPTNTSETLPLARVAWRWRRLGRRISIPCSRRMVCRLGTRP